MAPKGRPKSASPSERKLFGTDGIRGLANGDPLTPELALRLGRAIAWTAKKERGAAPRIVIGKDTRLSGYLLESALASGICAMGGTPLLAGVIPTPAIANLTHSLRADAGVVISASHNAFQDNGIKLFGADGFKLTDETESSIEALLEDPCLLSQGCTGARLGSAESLNDASGRYIVYAKSTFPRELTLKGLKVVVDSGHGAAHLVAPAVLSELGAEVIAIGCSPNGRNINLKSGALHPETTAREVLRRGADLGIALDGDADRLIVIDEKGQVIDGDSVIALCATHLLQQRRLPKRTVVTTVMSNMGLEVALKKAGGKLVRTPVGDRYVVAEMRRRGCTLGGEQSGHLVFLDHSTTGDGLVAALQVLAILVREGKPMSELRQVMSLVPQELHNLRLPQRRAISQMPLLLAAIHRAEKNLAQRGRVLVRWSGTEPLLRLMAEGPKPDKLKNLLEDLASAAKQDLESP